VIAARCPSCAATFRAKDEYAGRRVKCPSCKEPLSLPAAADGAPPAAAPAPARTPPAAAPPARDPPRAATAAAPARGTARKSKGARPHPAGRRGTRSASAGPPGWLLPALGGIAVAGFGVWLFLNTRGPDIAATYQQGVEAMQRGDYDTAIARFMAVPADSVFQPRAGEQLAMARQQQELRGSLATTRDAASAYGILTRLKTDYVDRGPSHPDYAAHTRYLLVRAREFLERFPEDARASEVQDWFRYYAKVASPDTPPTVRDMQVEVSMRATAYLFEEALAAIAQYAEQPGHDAEAVARMREHLAEVGRSHWEDVKDRLQRSESFRPGDENWLYIRNATGRVLEVLAPLPELVVEAREWHERALAALAQGD